MLSIFRLKFFAIIDRESPCSVVYVIASRRGALAGMTVLRSNCRGIVNEDATLAATVGKLIAGWIWFGFAVGSRCVAGEADPD
jgi:hypothetical protein